MKLISFEKTYFITGIIGLITAIFVLPIAIRYFCMESTVFSALVPSIVLAILISVFSFNVYKKGRYRLYIGTFLSSRKLLLVSLINIGIISGILY